MIYLASNILDLAENAVDYPTASMRVKLEEMRETNIAKWPIYDLWISCQDL